MRNRVILDTGPLISLLAARDPHHAWATRQWEEARFPLLSCDAAIAEACFLARQLAPHGPQKVLALVRSGAIALSFSLAEEIDQVDRLVAKYRDIPMSLSDACLVRMSELHPDSPVLTLDRDFNTYRRNRRQRIPVLGPEAAY